MATGNEGKDAQGRKFDQETGGGSSSAATMGTGGTGKLGNAQVDRPGSSASASAGGRQSAGRTDDLLAGGSEYDQNAQGFASGESTPELQTGMGDLGSFATGDAGSRQSDDAPQPGEEEGRTQAAGKQDSARLPESSAQRSGQKGDRRS